MNRIKDIEATLAARRAHEATNGHGVPSHLLRGPAPLLPQPVQVDFIAIANMIGACAQPGQPVPWTPAPGIEPVMVQMPDFGALALEYGKRLDVKYGAGIVPAEEADRLALVCMAAHLQREYHAIALRWNERQAKPAEQDALPEAPSEADARGPVGLDDGPGRDANGSWVE